jgi:hypothetical protein
MFSVTISPLKKATAIQAPMATLKIKVNLPLFEMMVWVNHLLV